MQRISQFLAHYNPFNSSYTNFLSTGMNSEVESGSQHGSQHGSQPVDDQTFTRPDTRNRHTSEPSAVWRTHAFRQARSCPVESPEHVSAPGSYYRNRGHNRQPQFGWPPEEDLDSSSPSLPLTEFSHTPPHSPTGSPSGSPSGSNAQDDPPARLSQTAVCPDLLTFLH